MRIVVLALGAVVAALVGDLRGAEASTWYPYCATYADASGMTKCSFATIEQCQATVSGIGGFCKTNPLPAPAGRARVTAAPAPRPVPPVISRITGRPWHPYCATYADAFGSTSCAFDSFEECRFTLGGNGGSCSANPFLPDGTRNVVKY